MNRRPFLARVTALILAPGLILPAAAAPVTRVLPLEHRPAEELLPLLRPLMGSGEVLTGQGFRLVVRAHPDTLAELEAVIRALDTEPARLRIHVRWGERSGDTRDGRRITTRREEDVRSLQVLEGQSALVRTQQTLPRGTARLVPVPGGMAVEPHLGRQRLESGFLVTPRLMPSGQVRLAIRSVRERPDPAGGGRSRGQAVETTISAPLGEWIPLSTLHQETAGDGRRVLRTRPPERRREQDLHLRIERMD
ncbi:MAG: hypothetical protein ACLFTM_03000 [Ectothiorhodospira sp.]